MMRPSTAARPARLAAALLLLAGSAALAQYRPADQGQRPRTDRTRILPEQFLRGYDPVTAYFDSDVGPGRASADDGAKHLKITPSWPGAWMWADKRTLQFRPAEPWPPLARFSIEAHGARQVLTTMMSAPDALRPEAGSDNLAPFREFTLRFPQALPLESLRQMLRLEIRDLPGTADVPGHVVKEFGLALQPRASEREAAVYAITLRNEVPEGKVLRVDVRLALGEEGRTLWTGRLSTRPPFHLQSVRCGAAEYPLVGVSALPRDMALACGSTGELPQLVFSAPVAGLTLSVLRTLARLEPAVPDLSFESFGGRVVLRGKFVPDTLYRLRLSAAPVKDESGRLLRDPGSPEIFFHRGWKSAFLRWSQASAMLESQGPRMLPLVGYGDARADVRIYRVDPLHTGLWPFPASPVVVNEQSAPPFPGEEPEKPTNQPHDPDNYNVQAHIRLLGSPLVSRVVDLPLAKRSGTTRFGLDLGPLVDPVVGANRPGTYLVGLRRLAGAPLRSYMRVQITNLSLTTVEEPERAIFHVRTLDKAEPVRGAKIVIEGLRRQGQHTVPDTATVSTDGDGRASLGRMPDWVSFRRVSVQKDDDVLVFDPHDPPPRFAGNHWSYSGSWLEWLATDNPPPPLNDALLGFVFTERPIYRPGETVHIKGWLRRRTGGKLDSPGDASAYGMRVDGPDGQPRPLPFSFSALAGFTADFIEKNPPTGEFSVVVFQKNPFREIARRPFRVEAFRIPTFEVQLSSPPAVRLDAPFKVRALARYYAGGNVTGQPISWTVTRRPYHHVPAGREGWLFASSEQFARPGAVRPPDTVTRSAKLDDSGADEMSVNPALDVDGSARTYRFEAVVTGPDNQPVAAATEVKALPPFVLGMKLQRYAEKAVDIRPEIIAVGVDDKLLGGQDVVVRLYRRVWHSNLRETSFAKGEAKYVTEQEDVKLKEETIKTSADKSVVPVFPVKDAGVYVVELVARDRLGRVQTLSADLFVGGPAPVAWKKSREGVFELSSDKKSYKPGETARLLVQSPFQTGRALVIVEEPGGNTYAWREVSGGKAVHEIRIQPHFVPNVPVHVVLMRGRTGLGQTEDGRYRPQTVASSLDLEIEPAKNKVDVALEHPETARPGQKIEIAVTLKDDDGKPLSGEVALWLVDEAVLSLAREESLDPLKPFVPRNQRATAARDSRNMVVGRLFEEEEEPGGDYAEEDLGGAPSKRVVRKNFQTVPYWAATLQVPASGRIVVPVQLSDDLTNFKVRAEAASGWTRFGYRQTVLRVRLPVLVQPQLPRFVRQGDRFWAGGLPRLLEGAPGPATVDFSLKGPAEAPAAAKVIDLKTVPEPFLVPVTVKSSAAGADTLAIEVGVTRQSDGAGDAFEIKLPVLPDRQMEQLAWFERLKPGELKLKPFPEAPRPGTALQKYLLTSVPGVLELATGLDYLAAYPHGCLEQRMSQVMPEISQGALLKMLGLDEGYGARAALGARRVLEDLAQFQDDAGFFAYWPGGTGDVQMTALAVEFLQAAKKAGLPVDAKIETRAIEALQRALRSDFPGLLPGYAWNQRVAAMRALVRTGRLDQHYMIDLFQHRDEMDVIALADLAFAMASQPAAWRANLDVLRGELWDSVILRLFQGRELFEGLKWRRSFWGGPYLASTTSAVATVFESLLLLDPGNARHGLLRDALLSNAGADRGFGSTFENRRALDALLLYMERAKGSAPPAKVALSGPRGPAASLAVDDAKKTALAQLALDQPLQASVQGEGGGLRVAYTWLPATPGDATTPLNQGFIVSRGYTLMPAGAQAQAQKPDKAGTTLKMGVGDILEVHAQLTSDEERFHVALVVPFAAGLEPLNPELANAPAEARPSQGDSIQASYVQRLDDEVRYYFVRLPRGQHSFHFRVRASTEGSFTHPAPRVEQMYRQDVRGRGEGMRIVVTGANEK